MDLVIDANILFAILIKEGKTEELLFEEDLHIFAPEFIFEEFEKYVDYFAVALKMKCPIWSNDKLLKTQKVVKIYSTEELVKMF